MPAAAEILDKVYLEVRAKLLELAAALDRVDRASGAAGLADPRLGQIQQSFAVLSSTEPNRAERIQIIFSDPYQADWNPPAVRKN